MPNNTVKIAISLPKKEYEFLEKFRHRMGLSRSAIIDKAVSFWIKRQNDEGFIKKYEKAYKDKPEKVREIMVWEKSGMEALSQKEDW